MCLTGASLAPGTDETFDAMQNRRPQEVVRNILKDILEFEPDVPVQVDRKAFLKCLKSAPKGSSPGPGGLHLRTSQNLGRRRGHNGSPVRSRDQFGTSPGPTNHLQRIDVGQTHSAQEGRRRSERHCHRVHLCDDARTLAKQFAKDFEEECAPFQYALSNRHRSPGDNPQRRWDWGIRPRAPGFDAGKVGKLSSGSLTHHRQSTVGWMSREGLAQCIKQRAVSKETPSCPFCSQWASKTRWRTEVWFVITTHQKKCISFGDQRRVCEGVIPYRKTRGRVIHPKTVPEIQVKDDNAER